MIRNCVTVQLDPRLIVGSWRRRWNSSLPDAYPLAICDEEWAATHRLLALTKFNVRTEQRDTGHGRDRAGFTGIATLRLARNMPSLPARSSARFPVSPSTAAPAPRSRTASALPP